MLQHTWGFVLVAVFANRRAKPVTRHEDQCLANAAVNVLQAQTAWSTCIQLDVQPYIIAEMVQSRRLATHLHLQAWLVRRR